MNIRTHSHTQGSIYILTLVSALVLMGLGLGLALNILQYRRASRSDLKIEEARIYAELGIRHALRYTIDDSNWRQHLNSGTWLQDITAGAATYSVTGIDTADGVLPNNDSDPVKITCTATVEGVTRTIQVNTRQQPYEILRYAVVAGGDVDISSYARVTGNVASNDDIHKSGDYSWIVGNAEAVDTIYETSHITGTVAPGSAAREFPSQSSIFSYYQAATPIAYRSSMERILLSPTKNPYGSTNPDGLYKMNCANQKVVIKQCRIVGTLFLINPRSDSRIEISINWKPARPDYPALIIEGPCLEIITYQDLKEYEIGYVDLNLPGESGYGSALNTFSNEINGLVYSTGNLILEQTIQIKGSLIALGEIDLRDYSRCIYNASVYDNAPVMFHMPSLYPVAGSWTQVLPSQ